MDDKGHLRVGGIDLLDLAQEFGTPLFVYDEAHLRHACREAVAAWGDGVAYATKAFLCRAMARLAHEEGMHLDVASGGELHVALAAGVPPERLVLHGNNKSTDELAAALAARGGAHRGRLVRRDRPPRAPARFGPDRCRSGPQVLVRVTPGVEAHTHEFVRTGQEDSKFGFSVSLGCGRRGRGRARAVARRRAGRGARAHRQPGLRRPLPSRRPPRCSVGSSPRSVLPELVVGGGLGVALRQRRIGAHPGRVGGRHARGLRRGRCRPGDADLRRARALHRGDRRPHALHGRARSSTCRASAPTSVSTGA